MQQSLRPNWGPLYELASRRQRADLEHNPDGFHLLALMLDGLVNIFTRLHICVEGRNAREAASCRQEQNSFRCDRRASACRRRCCSCLQAGSVLSVLHDTVASHDTTDKLKVELTNISKPEGVLLCRLSMRLSETFQGTCFFGSLRSSPKSKNDVIPKRPPMMIRDFDAFEQQQLVDMKLLCFTSYMMLSTTSAAIPRSTL